MLSLQDRNISSEAIFMFQEAVTYSWVIPIVYHRHFFCFYIAQGVCMV